MTVNQLINKLKKMPEDARVVIENDFMYVKGIYQVVSSEVEYYPEDNIVVVGTDYEEKVKR